MLLTKVSIHSVAHLEAPNPITSAEISERLAETLKRVRLPKNLLERMTGIKERRFWPGDKQPSEVASEVAEKVIQKSGLVRKEIGAIISTSVTRDFLEPSIASVIHSRLMLSAECLNFDITSACLGFLNGMQVASLMIENGAANHVLIVSGESGLGFEGTIQRLAKASTTIQDVRSELATLTLGSGGVAMILSRSDLAPQGHRINGWVTLAATAHHNLCFGWPDRMETNAPELLKQANLLKQKTHRLAQKTFGWTAENVDEYAFHQVGKSFIDTAIRLTGVPEHKVLRTYPNYGNLISAALPFTVSKLEEMGRLVKGKRLALVGAGSGLNSMAIDILW